MLVSGSPVQLLIYYHFKIHLIMDKTTQTDSGSISEPGNREQNPSNTFHGRPYLPPDCICTTCAYIRALESKIILEQRVSKIEILLTKLAESSDWMKNTLEELREIAELK
jgi:hypothetical protein